MEAAARGGAAPAHADAGWLSAEDVPGFAPGDDAGDVVVRHHRLFREASPPGGEHADGGGAAADVHPLPPRAGRDWGRRRTGR